MKKAYYKHCYHRDNENPNRIEVRIKALGERHVFKKDGFKFIAYYDSKNKTFTEESTGMIVSARRSKNKAEAILIVEAAFEIIRNNLLTTFKDVNVMDLPELESNEVSCNV